MQKLYEEPFIPGIKYEIADILATHYAKLRLNKKVSSQNKIYKEHFELLTGLSTKELYEMYSEANRKSKISEGEVISNGSVQTLKFYLNRLADICGRCFPPQPNHVKNLMVMTEHELNRLSHISKSLYEKYKEEFENLRQHSFLKPKKIKEEELILTP